MDVPSSFNSIVYATMQPTVVGNLYQNYEQLRAAGAHPLLLEALQTVILNLQPTDTNERAFTDDWSPIELITNNMVLSFVLGGETEELK
jgi:hypothetical protein